MDLDQGGNFILTEWANVYLGPSIGWVRRPALNRVNVLAGGTTNIDLAINLVTVQFNGAVTLILPNTILSTARGSQAAQPGITAITSITIVDVGGFAGANPITIQPFAGGSIMSLPSISISVNYGGYTLLPSKSQANFWSSISP